MLENIGERIKNLRNERGLTLSEFGKLVNLSPSYLSQIENGKTSPSLTTLIDMGRLLDVEIRTFFEDTSEVAFISRAAKREALDADALPLIKTNLMPAMGNRALEVYRITLQANTHPEYQDFFSGEEFYYILSGFLNIQVGEELIELAANDSVHIDAYQTHSWSNPANEPCVFVWGRAASLEKL